MLTSFVPSGNVASTCISGIISAMPSITWSRISTLRLSDMRSATDLPSRAASKTKSVMSARVSGELSLTPLLSRSRATIAASEIISLSFSRGVRFINFSVSAESLTRPHLRYLEGSGTEFWPELLDKAAQRKLQIKGLFRRKTEDNKSAYQCRRTIASQGRNNLPQKL